MRHRLADREMFRRVEKAPVGDPRRPAHLCSGLRKLKQRLQAKVERKKHLRKRKDFLGKLLGI